VRSATVFLRARLILAPPRLIAAELVTGAGAQST
jgi:hypothetical protein